MAGLSAAQLSVLRAAVAAQPPAQQREVVVMAEVAAQLRGVVRLAALCATVAVQPPVQR